MSGRDVPNHAPRSMLSFLAAVIYMCMVQSDTVTRVITGVLLGLMTIIVVAVLLASWGSVAPATKTLWQRNQEIAEAAVKSTSRAVDGMLHRFSATRVDTDKSSYKHVP